MTHPAIAFVIPAFNAAETLENCIRSLQGQTKQNWQAIVVDDGSTDETRALAESWARSDSRIQVIAQHNAGAAAARNAGVSAANAAFICFLDADDWIDRRFLEVMLPVALKSKQRNVVPYCDYWRVYDTGSRTRVSPPDLNGENAKLRFSEWCALAIHGAILPTHLFHSAGGMDESLRTCEDWALWLRVAFNGAEFQRVRGCYCSYRIRQGSLSSNPLGMLDDALSVSNLAQGLWAAVGAAPKTEQDWSFARIRLIGWAAGLGAASSPDPSYFLSRIRREADFLGCIDEFASAFAFGLDMNRGADGHEVRKVDPQAWAPFAEALFAQCETHLRAGIKRALWVALARQLAARWAFHASWVAGPVVVVNVDLGADVAPIKEQPNLDAVVLRISDGRRALRMLEVPVFGDLSADEVVTIAASAIRLRSVRSAKALARALTVRRAFPIDLARHYRAFARVVRRQSISHWLGWLRLLWQHQLRRQLLQARLSVHRRQSQDGSGEPSSAYPQSIPTRPSHTSADGRVAYWEGIFAQPDPWNYLSPYEIKKYDQTLSLLSNRPNTRALEIACAEGIFTRMLSSHVVALTAADISTTALGRAAERCRDTANVEFRQMDVVKDNLGGTFDLIVCSEVLYFLERAALQSVARKVANALAPGGIFITAHAHLIADEAHRTGFDWDNLFGVATIREAFQSCPELTLEHTIETDLYAIHRFRKTSGGSASSQPIVESADYGKPLDANVEAGIVWEGAATTRRWAFANEQRQAIPILMYHRLGNDAPPGLRRYQTAPSDFRDQLLFLRRNGYYSVSTDDVMRKLAQGKTFPGRPVVITFDDAYKDFIDEGLPLLVRSGFTAEVFVVTDLVGQVARWDAGIAVPAPLMDWDDLRSIKGAGIAIGSHLATHSPASFLTSRQLLDEATRSRTTLESALDQKVTSVALPHGVFDDRVDDLVALAGYGVGLSTDPGLASLSSNPFRLPRIEIRGGIDISEFATQLGLAPPGNPPPSSPRH